MLPSLRPITPLSPSTRSAASSSNPPLSVSSVHSSSSNDHNSGTSAGANIAEAISGEELRYLQNYFQDVDEVDEDEFIELFRSLGGKFAEFDDKDYLHFFQKVDANANGMLDLDELLTWLLCGLSGQRRMNDVSQDVNNVKWIKGSNNVPDLHKGKIQSIIVDAEHDKYYTASRDGNIKVWSTTTLQYEKTLHQSNKSLTDMCLIPKYKQLAACDLGRQVCFYDVITGQIDRIYQGKISKIHPLHIDKPRRAKSLSETSSNKRKAKIGGKHSMSTTLLQEQRKEWLQDKRENLTGAERKPKKNTEDYPILVLEQLGNKGNTPMAMAMYHTNVTGKFSQDFMIFGCENGKVKIYDVTDKNPDSNSVSPLFSQKITSAGVTSMTVGHDLNALILASYDSVIEVFSLEKFETISTLRGHKRPVHRLDYSNALNLIVSCGREKNVLVWNPLIKKPLEVLRGHKSPVIDVKFNTKDMELITLSDDKIMKVWDVRMYKCVQTMHNVGGANATITTAAFNPKQECLVCGGFEFGRAELISVPLHRSHLSYKAQYSGPSHPIVAVLFKEQFGEVILADEFSVSVWNYYTGGLIFKFDIAEGVAACRFDPKKRRVIVAYHNQDAGIYNYVNGGRLKLLESEEEVYFNMYIDIKNGDEDCEDDNAIWGLANHEIVTWEDSEDLEKEEPSAVITLPFIAMCGCVVDSLCILGFEDGTLRQYDSRTGAVRLNKKFSQPSQIDDLVTRKVTGTKKKKSTSWSMAQRSRVTNHVECIVAPEKKYPLVIVSYGNGTIELWNAVTLEKAYLFRANPNRESVCCMACDEEGTTLVTGDSDGYIAVFDISGVQIVDPQAQYDHHEVQVPVGSVTLQTRFRAFNDVVTSIVLDLSMKKVIAGSSSTFAAIFSLRGDTIGYFGQTASWNLNDTSTYDQGRTDKPIQNQLVDRDQYSQIEVKQHVIRRMALKKFVRHKNEKRVELEDLESELRKKIAQKQQNLDHVNLLGSPSAQERWKERLSPAMSHMQSGPGSDSITEELLVPALLQSETKRDVESFSKEFLSHFHQI
eukprot:CAMPEP_0117437586 /NCGR_PEP_ID=MMETSP0759-20121206/1600_1 /TAXON_ID=63605 /ORGANISM="Percolomonas cosmopolitus, Strain WS" /LENGTH=1048 /DNA_ID=CAMNT_0005229223 /DNA_START=390 /DNA_END=3536 /DNA_ORIENTATION=-